MMTRVRRERVERRIKTEWKYRSRLISIPERKPDTFWFL